MKKTRLAYLDNVRSLVIFLVIVMHTAVTYSGIGSWYYTEGSVEKLPLFEMVFFGFMQSFLQAWFMGILFFISAIFAAKALEKRGPSKFIKERLFRLGLPLLLYIFVISPIIIFILLGINPGNSFGENYILYITDLWWVGSTGPLWFIETLLIFSAVYTLIKKLFPKKIIIRNIGPKDIIFIILITGMISFLIRLVCPIGTSYQNLQFCYFSSYIAMFIAGILSGENDLLEEISNGKNIKWLKLSLITGTPLWVFTMVLGGALEGKSYYNGGFNWQSLAYAFWESLTAIGFSLGLIALFRKRVNIENKFTCLLRDNAFGIYFFHAPLLVSVSLLFRSLVFDSLLKFAAVTVITFLTCFLFTFLVRKIKPIGVLLK